MLEIDGQRLGQTLVICRYLGEKHKLAVEDSWTATRQQEAVEYLHDLSNTIAYALYSRLVGKGSLLSSHTELISSFGLITSISLP